MNDNATERDNDETSGTKIARWAAWTVIAAIIFFFFVYAAMYH